MKRFILNVILIGATVSAFAGSPSKLFDEFKNNENAEYVKVPRFLMKCAGLVGALNDIPMVGNVNGVKVLDLSGASKNLHDDFMRRFGQETDGMEELIRVNDDGDKVRILTKIDGDKFRDLLILSEDGSDLSLVQLSGKFSQEDLDKLMEQQD